mgnify:CR=1 FL=1
MDGRKKHFKIHFPVNEELNVREVFAMFHQDLGYRIIESRSEFPDYILEDESGKKIRAEVERVASEFRKHKHPIEECDLIICWYNDWPDCPIEVLELCRFVEEPYSDVSFSREELAELPEIYRKIDELTQKREGIINRLKWVIYDLDEFIRRNDHQAMTSRWNLTIWCGRSGWSAHFICLDIDPRKGTVEIRGDLNPDIISTYGREELQQLVDEVKNEGFFIGDSQRRPLKVEEILKKLTETEVRDIYIFRLHDLVEIANKPSEEIVKMLGDEVLKLLDFMDRKRLVKVASEE